MRPFGPVVLALALLLPAAAEAQTPAVTSASLVGTWERATKVLQSSDGIPIQLDSAMAKQFSASAFVTQYDTLFVQADNSFHFRGKDFKTDVFHWRSLKGDTLALYDNGACVKGTGGKDCSACYVPGVREYGLTGGDCLRGEPGYLVTLKDDKLTLTMLKGTSNAWEEGVYRRVEAPTPKP